MKAAIYARYSTDKQSEASIADQVRVCERLAERHGFKIVATFQDAAMSGGTTRRPGYQAMLAAARRREFQVIVAEDTSRLWRALSEQSPRLAELSDLSIEVVTHDLDTRQESGAIMGAVSGAMAEQYRREIGRRTRRGLEGLARQGKSAGGRAYGYIPAALSGTGLVEIDPDQAVVVREIFDLYAAGWSPRAIAAELNRRGVPSPGSAWKRSQRRQSGWMSSAIAGDPSRGIGILNNEAYVGRQVWNRLRWVRSASDSHKRRSVLNPRSEWIVRDDLRLRIVPEQLWEAVKARQVEAAHVRGDRVRAGLSPRTGAGPKYLLSGMLKCGDCGASFVIADRTHYACSSRVHGRACDNAVRIKRSIVEAGILAGTKRELLRPEVIAEARKRVMRALKGRKEQPVDRKRLAQLQREIGNLTDAIAAGALRASPAIAARLQSAEAELARIQAVKPAPKVSALPTGIEDRWRAKVANLETVLMAHDPARSRTVLHSLIGDVQVITTAQEIRFETKKGAVEGAFVRAAGSQQISVVAGAGFEPATFGL
jgi:site-specific DNA recombinase